MSDPAQTTADTIRSAVVDAVQCADRAGELCGCKSENSLIDGLTEFLVSRLCGGETDAG